MNFLFYTLLCGFIDNKHLTKRLDITTVLDGKFQKGFNYNEDQMRRYINKLVDLSQKYFEPIEIELKLVKIYFTNETTSNNPYGASVYAKEKKFLSEADAVVFFEDVVVKEHEGKYQVGSALVGWICGVGSVAIVLKKSTQEKTAEIMSHELFHVLGFEHVKVTESNCNHDCLMNPYVSAHAHVSKFTINRANSLRPMWKCLYDFPTVNDDRNTKDESRGANFWIYAFFIFLGLY